LKTSGNEQVMVLQNFRITFLAEKVFAYHHIASTHACIQSCRSHSLVICTVY